MNIRVKALLLTVVYIVLGISALVGLGFTILHMPVLIFFLGVGAILLLVGRAVYLDVKLRLERKAEERR